MTANGPNSLEDWMAREEAAWLKEQRHWRPRIPTIVVALGVSLAFWAAIWAAIWIFLAR